MSKTLSTDEIKHRLIRLRNLENNLYPAARARIEKLEARIKVLEAEKAKWKIEKAEMQTVIQKLLLQVDALNTKVFGKKHSSGSDKQGKTKDNPKPKSKRSSDSYRRSIPSEDEITDHQTHSIDRSSNSLHYGHNLSEHKTVDYFEEDVIPPDAVNLKTVTRHTIETAYCEDCKTWVYGRDIPKQKVVLGDNLPMLVSFLSTVARFSYQQIVEHIELFYHIKISDCAIAGMLEKQATRLRPAYERLIKSILAQKGIHFDESSWKMLIEKFGNYVWVMTGTDNRDAAFFFGQSRGKKVLTDKLLAPLKKTGKKIIGISDDYGGYRRVEQFFEHALCWAHPNRKLRDLAESKNLSKIYRAHCQKVYKQFNRLYSDVIDLWLADIPEEEREKQADQLKEQFNKVASPCDKDPPQLATYKDSLRSNKEAYFVCLKYPGIIPPDNNKAERAIRHLVIKRKACFGSKTQKGADVLSVLYSVLLSLYWRKPDNYFSEYRKLLEISA